jgi:hypothetical protein
MLPHKTKPTLPFPVIPQNQRHRGIMTLIHSAQVDALVCRRIQQILKSCNHVNEPGFLIRASNNAFGAAVETLHALLDSNFEDELRIEPALVEIVRRDKEGKFDRIKKEKLDKCYELIKKHYPNPECYTFNFDFLTDQSDPRLAGDILRDVQRTKRLLSGIKDLKELQKEYRKQRFHEMRNWFISHKTARQSFTGTGRLLLKKSILEALEKIIRELSIQACFWFNYELANHDLKPVLQDLEKHILVYTAGHEERGS